MYALKAEIDTTTNSIIIAGTYYRPSVISVTVTKGGHLSGSKLYKTSKTIGRGVAELYKSLVRKNVGTWEYI